MGHKAGKCLHSKVVCPISEMYKRNMDHTEMNLVYVINEPSTFHMTLKTIIMLNWAYFLYYNMNRSCFGYSSHKMSQDRHLSVQCPSRCSIVASGHAWDVQSTIYSLTIKSINQ